MEHFRNKPYIGVTGITLPSQAEAVARTFAAEGLTDEQSSHQGMIGILATQRTLTPDMTRAAKHPNLTGIRRIFQTTQGRTFNTLHYSTSARSDLSQQLSLLLGQTGLYADRLCHGIQLNLFWPPPSELERTKVMFPDLKIILQLGPRVLSERSVEDIVKGLNDYQGVIDYTLIDPSGGKGMIFETNTVALIHNQIKEIYPDLPVVFAGGFNARNIKTRLFLLYQVIGFRDFGIDAEKGLRIQSRGKAITDISPSKAIHYIRNAASFFRIDQAKPNTTS